MKLEKYHGLGNSFLLMEHVENKDYKALAKSLCDDKISVGADGLIIVKKEPLEMLIFNKDGTEAMMCGNGLRCFIHYCFNNGFLKERFGKIDVITKGGIYVVDIDSKAPFLTRTYFPRNLIRKDLIEKDNLLIDSYFIKVGVKHNVIVIDKSNRKTIEQLKNILLKQVSFSDETNIDIVEIIDRETIKVETFERGVGFTSSCGTGGVASALVCNYLYSCSNNIKIVSKYGNLNIEIIGNKVYMVGPSEKICDIEVDYD